MPELSMPLHFDRGHNPASVEAATAAVMPKPSVPPQLDRGHNPASMEAETAAVMRNSCVPTQHDGGYNPASTAAMTASATETAQHEHVPLKASKLFNKVGHSNMGNEDVVNMSGYLQIGHVIA